MPRTLSSSPSPGSSRSGTQSDSSTTPGVLTPSSDASRSPVPFRVFEPDVPVPSIENGVELLQVRDSNTPETESLSPDDRLSPPVDIQLDGLRLDSPAPEAMTGARGSLSPEANGRQRSRPIYRRRSRQSSPMLRDRHNVEREVLPELPYYSPDFQEALRQSTALAEELKDVLSSSYLHTDENSVIHGLFQQARDAASFRGPQNWKLGLVGDSGAGKSSLITSLLDTRSLARVSNAGAACTCTVTEYHYHDRETYSVDVFYFTRAQVLSQLEEHLHAFRRYHEEMSARPGNPAESAEARQIREELQQAKTMAWDTITASFSAQRGVTEDMLRTESEATLLRNFSTWIDQDSPQEFRQSTATSSPYHQERDDETSCAELLNQMTSNISHEGSAAQWPFVSKVIVTLRAYILSKGLILVDLPGLRDTNCARRMITERYLVQCDGIFAVANIGRALTDEGVKSVVDLAQRTRRQSVGIVCTRSDDIRAEEYRNDVRGITRREIDRLIDRLDDCQSEVNRIEDELRELDDYSDDDVDEAEINDLNREKRIKGRDRDRLEFELQEKIVVHRNTKVINGLQRKYSPLVRHIFCISNTLYWDKRDRRDELGQMWLQLSNIIDLRRHCIGLVGAQQLRDGTDFINNTIANLVASADLWVQSGSATIAAETRAQIREAANRTERVLRMEFGKPEFQNIKAALDQILENRVTTQCTRARYTAWRKTAQEATYSWSGWAWNTYAAFCRNYGEHTLGSVGYRCWNEEIIEGMVGDLEAALQTASDEIQLFFTTREQSIRSSFQRALRPLRAINLTNMDRENADSIQTLILAITQHGTSLRADANKAARVHSKKLINLVNADLLSGIRTSFIGQLMEDTYERAARDSGRGVDARRKTLIASRVDSQQLFQDIIRSLETAFENLSTSVEAKLHATNDRHVRAVRTALDTLSSVNAVLESERDPGFRERLRVRVASANRELPEIQRLIPAAE